VHVRVASGNVTDDQTHQDNWELLCQIAGRCDFLYVADCKLATVANMAYIADKGGRFVSVLPRTRKEDAAFRTRLLEGTVTWQPLWDKLDDTGVVYDRFTVADAADTVPEGYRLWWFHSSRKAEADLAARSGRLQRAEQHLRQLQAKLRGPRARQRDQGKVQETVQKILEHYDVTAWLHAEVVTRPHETFRQRRRGRPGANTEYVKKVTTRLDLEYRLLAEPLARERRTDGVFPLVTNADELTALEILHAYKRQPYVEKRFEQLKTDFAVAPVFLKDVGRIEALLCVYFLALLVEALLERELRRAMQRAGLASLPLYPEGRPCRRPTARRLLDLFETVQRHTIRQADAEPQTVASDLTPLQRRLLRLLGLAEANYES
jgi:transposase